MTTHRIYPAWKELLVYEESPDRKLQFQCDCVEPYQVHLPAPELWPTQTPPWAHDRRDLILNRLRAANCIICEVDRTTISILSPDNTFRVEIYSEPDDRGHPLRALRIRTTNNQLLADIHDAHLTAEVTFPAPGELILPFNLNSTRYKIAINIPNKTFSFLPNGGTSVPLSSHSVLSPQHSVLSSSHPLDHLIPLLSTQSPTPPPYKAATIGRHPPLLISIALLSSCLLFIATGIWQSLAGPTPRDHFLGVLCTLFFTLCAIPPTNNLRQSLRSHKRLDQ